MITYTITGNITHKPYKRAVKILNSEPQLCCIQMYTTILSTISLISDLEVDIDYPDNNINDGCQVKTNTPNDCLHYCQMYPGCKGFSWVNPDFHYCPKACWIKSKMEGRKYHENVISGFAGNSEILNLK